MCARRIAVLARSSATAAARSRARAASETWDSEYLLMSGDSAGTGRRGHTHSYHAQFRRYGSHPDATPASRPGTFLARVARMQERTSQTRWRAVGVGAPDMRASP